jgi:hypothetical protein
MVIDHLDTNPFVTPAKAGVQLATGKKSKLDSGFRRDDDQREACAELTEKQFAALLEPTAATR